MEENNLHNTSCCGYCEIMYTIYTSRLTTGSSGEGRDGRKEIMDIIY